MIRFEKAKQDTVEAASETQTGLRAMRRVNVWVGGRFERSLQHAQQERGQHQTLLLLAGISAVGELAFSLNSHVGPAYAVAAIVMLLAVGALRERVLKVTIGLAIIPFTQLVSSCFITKSNLQTDIIFYSTILLLAVIYRYLFMLDEPAKLRESEIRIGYKLWLLLPVAAIGCGLLQYFTLRSQYLFPGTMTSAVIIAAVISSFGEILLFQGIIQQQAMKVFSPLFAAILAGVTYFLLAYDYNIVGTIVPAAAISVLLPVVYYRTRNTAFCSLIAVTAKLTYALLITARIL